MSLYKSVAAVVEAAGIALACSVTAILIGVLAAYPDDVEAKPVAATGSVTISTDLAYDVVPSEGGKIYLHIGLEAIRREFSEADRPPVNIALVIDQSGSMRGPRLASAKLAAKEALSRLSRNDTLALVAYNHRVDVLRDAGRVRNFSDIEDAIDQLRAEGRTALYAGVQEGGRQLGRYLSDRQINRVVLLSDGMANVGPSKPRELSRLGQKLAGDGISVTTIGLGLNYNEDLMQQLALASDGNHAFAEKPDDLARIFNSEFGDALGAGARDIEIIIEVHKGYRPTRILGPKGDIDGNRVKVRFGQLTGGFERYLVVELDAEAGGTASVREDVADVRVGYMDLIGGTRQSHEATVQAERSADTARVEASANAAILAKVGEQKSVVATKEAIKLRDKGDIAAARKVLNETNNRLTLIEERHGLSGASATRLKAAKKRAAAAAQSLDRKDWAKTRKALRYEQQKYGSSQSY